LGRVVRIKPNQLYGALANEEQPNFGLFTALPASTNTLIITPLYILLDDKCNKKHSA
jgi:hypothetical protein